MLLTVTLLLFYFSIGAIYANLTVNIAQGWLKGKESTSILHGTKYYTFSGIPYAQPPIGELRFMPPVPSGKWDGILDATRERNSCVQASLSPKFQLESLKGDEDCLYLNVYTPQPPTDIKIPKAVMVWIHGGAFYIGSGKRDYNGPDYLIKYDIILVTVNYRLQALGFLNLGILDAAGNQGLKDQTLALKWIRQNIRHFGGDPDKVTIFGQSAGAASVHHHTFSPLSAGLFQRAILESGHVFTSWAITSKTVESGYALGRKMGFVGNTSQELVQFLKTKSAYSITQTVHETLDLINGLAFIPTIETVGENKFISDWPSKLLNNVHQVPMIIGTMQEEWQGIFRSSQSSDEAEKMLQFIILHEFKIVENSRLLAIVDKIKKYYLRDKPISNETIGELIQIPQDLFVLRFYDAIEIKSDASSPTYMYQFEYLGNLNEWQERYLHQEQNFKRSVTVHSEELGYLFYISLNFPNGTFCIDPDDMKIIEYMCSFWTNFAKTGNPSYQNIQWSPSYPHQSAYLKIRLQPTLIPRKIIGDGFLFWKELMQTEKLEYRF